MKVKYIILVTVALIFCYLMAKIILSPRSVSRSRTTGPIVVSTRDVSEKQARADEFLLNGDPDSAIRLYLSDRALRLNQPESQHEDSLLLCKIGTCYQFMGKYPEAIQAFEQADSYSNSLTSSSTIDGLIAYLATISGDANALSWATDKARRRLVDYLVDRQKFGGKADDSVTNAMLSGPGHTTNEKARNYLTFARDFNQLAMRKQADFAYCKALELTHNEPSIALEYGLALKGYFDDQKSSVKLLRLVSGSGDHGSSERAKANLRNITANSPVDQSELKARKSAIFRSSGLL